MADKIEEHKKNPRVGFRCLHYSVSEGSGHIDIAVLNKTGESFSVGVRTVDGEAKEGDDYIKFNEVITFDKGMSEKSIKVGIIDDDDWEPDEDFYVELYEPEGQERLEGEDTKCTVTIIDDDKPGVLSFENRTVKVVASDEKAIIKVTRANGCDGTITCKFKTIELDDTPHTAEKNVDYEHTEGLITFKHTEIEQEIVINILPRESDEPREEIFGVKIYDP